MRGIIYGRLTKDPEKKTGTKDGKDWTIVNFTVAEDNLYPRDDTSFYDCQVSGKRAEAIFNYFKKGSAIYAYGDLRQEPYTDKEGNTKRPWRFHVEDFRFDICAKSDSMKTGKDSSSQSDSSDPEGFAAVDEDIPF